MLTVKELDFYYGKVQVLKKVSFSVEEGIVGLVGPTGAGKSTILRIISGLLRPANGKLVYKDIDLTKLKPHEIVQLGIVHIPERRRIFPEMTVRENLELGAYGRKGKNEIKQDLEYLYSLIPLLKERDKQLGGTLSGGEQQLLAIGRGYMSKPRFLLVDEPTLGLSPVAAQLVMDVLAELNKKGIPILMVEENLELALQVAAGLYLVRGGEVVISGSSDEIKNELQEDRMRSEWIFV